MVWFRRKRVVFPVVTLGKYYYIFIVLMWFKSMINNFGNSKVVTNRFFHIVVWKHGENNLANIVVYFPLLLPNPSFHHKSTNSSLVNFQDPCFKYNGIANKCSKPRSPHTQLRFTFTKLSSTTPLDFSLQAVIINLLLEPISVQVSKQHIISHYSIICTYP